ncbi:alpha/beta hydrolase [Sphaerisporangium sp. NPDC051017]|uniref:alpha/beta fold hydrolase n=1 Tax=Sphaerisporangium sp. NPDC051017 TaxID=3154636 RepID=UPI00344925AE
MSSDGGSGPQPGFDWRKAIADNQTLPAAGVEDHRTVRIGGIDQWVSVRGSHRDNPLLLFLHGGPGSPMMGESWSFQRPWEDFFTVVQWDQRGAGKTYRSNGRGHETDLTIDLMQADAEDLIEHLLERYGQQRLVLVGHSWGTVLGMRIALARPELLHAYVSIGQVVNMRRNEAVSYRRTLAIARERGDQEAIADLEAIAPYPDAAPLPMSSMLVERRWVEAYGGMIHALAQDDEVQRLRMSPLYDEFDIEATEHGALASVEALWAELMCIDFDGVRSLDCPFFVIAGAEDLATPAELAREMFDQIEAPHGEYIELPRVAHYAFLEAPGVVLVKLVQLVLPLASVDRV